MLAHTCAACGGTGMEAPLGQNGYGVIYAGACSRCSGKGLTLHAPSPKADPLWYLTPAEREQLERDNAAAQEYHAEQQDWFYRHEHHFS